MGHEPKKTAVFLGPSLDRETAESILDADYYSPVRFGDVYRLLAMGIETIVIIDGVFHSTPSVWPREVMAALAEGIRVIGAASMGALRAAELHSFGMVGVGQVFEWYRDGVLRADDEVALQHATEAGGYRPLSEPLVNIRATLNAAVAKAIITGSQAEVLLQYCQRLPYPQRSFAALSAHVAEQAWSSETQISLQRFLTEQRVDIKRQDAILALREAPHVLPPPPVAWVSSDWDRLRSFLPAVSCSRGWVAPGALLAIFKRDKARARELARRARRLFFVSRWLEGRALALPNGEDAWHVVHPDREVDAFRRANGLSPKMFVELAEWKAHCDWALENVDGLVPEIPAILPAEDRFAVSWARANGVTLSEQRQEEVAARGSGQRAVDPLQVVGKMLLHSKQRTTEYGLVHLARWLVAQGPGHFGYPWEEDSEVWRLLQIEGEAEKLVDIFFDEVEP
ncbi:MAG: hypothetical protein A2289_10470 [Deltaproteobacteria bacterium RIFOXYA12_FULL_58_15]|nr:MAG: hypothetical protein A2289_10470 [Deltaproteobacteria bacterium RIFOXYA12_FULL_58_15]